MGALFVKLAWERLSSLERQKRVMFKKRQQELLRRGKTLTEEQKLALQERDKLKARLARCRATRDNLKEQLRRNEQRMIQANKKAQRLKKMQERRKNKELAEQWEVRKETLEESEQGNKLPHAVNGKIDSERHVEFNSSPQNCLQSTSSYYYVLQTYRNDSDHGANKSNQAYAPVNNQGTDIIHDSAGPIQPCNTFHQPTVHPVPVSNTPSCSKLEIKCEVEDSDESILKSLPDLGIVKKEPLDPSDVANESELLYSTNQSASGCEPRGELSLNNTEFKAIKPDPGEEMVISLDPVNILP